MDKIEVKIIEILRELIGDDIEIDEEIGFFDLGISSLTIASLCERVNEEFGICCDETDVFNNSNLTEFVEFVYSKK
ncbi:acyl carrier protein [Eubacterium sp.]|uniref:acyl carrier protein n=1 Tax=Eubacterium sp. TaxID=142586 RepID=UPI003520D426